MNTQNKTKRLLIALLLAGLFVLPSVALAQEEEDPFTYTPTSYAATVSPGGSTSIAVSLGVSGTGPALTYPVTTAGWGLTSGLPTGWSVTPSAATYSWASVDAKVSVSLTISVPSTATSGTYPFTAKLAPGQDSSSPPPASNPKTVGAGDGIAFSITVPTAPTADTTPPLVNVSFPAADGLNGWFATSPVIGSVSASDTSNVTSITATGAALSNVTGLGTPDASGALTVSAEGTNSVVATAIDGKGNSGAAPGSNNTAEIKVDTKPPVITAGIPSGTAGDNGWWRSDVAVPFSATDNASGFDPDGALSINMPSKTTSGEGSALYVTSDGISDRAGNTAEGISSGPYMVDWTAPTLTWGDIAPAPNGNGWNKEPVQISFTTADNLSGVVSASPASPLSFSSEGASQTQVVTVTDAAGNSAESTSPAVNIDLSAPLVTIITPADGAVYVLNQAVNADWSATDALSDIASAVATVASGSPIDTATVGPKAFTVTATDKAGNEASVTVTYTVKYGFKGLLAPYQAPPKAFKINSSIPLKWQYTDFEDNVVESPSANPSVAIKPVTLGETLVYGAPITVEDPGKSGYQYDSLTMTWQFNWQTKGLSAGIYAIFIQSKETGQNNGPIVIQLSR
jgi:hypothetical protein